MTSHEPKTCPLCTGVLDESLWKIGVCPRCRVRWGEPDKGNPIFRIDLPHRSTATFELKLRHEVSLFDAGWSSFLPASAVTITLGLILLTRRDGLHSGKSWLLLLLAISAALASLGLSTAWLFAARRWILRAMRPARLHAHDGVIDIELWPTWTELFSYRFRRTQITLPWSHITGVMVEEAAHARGQLMLLHASGMCIATGWQPPRSETINACKLIGEAAVPTSKA